MSVLISNSTNTEDLRELEKLFLRLDVSQDGVLEIKELKAGLSEVYGGLSTTQEEWEELIGKMDVDGDGKIDYKEFLLAA